jgi:glycosyltransferase involved in cell wall biosynthesis
MKTPELTYIVTSYNYGKFLNENLESLCQQWTQENPFNIIVVDDGSKDDSLNIVHSFSQKYPFLSLLTHPGNKNEGLINSMKLAINAVNTPWVAFLESDDISKSGSVKNLLKIMKIGAGVIFCNIEPLGLKKDDSNWFQSYVPRICEKMLELRADERPINLDSLILTENLIPTFSCVAVKTKLLKEADFNSPVPEWIDWFLWIQICQKAKVSFIPEKLVFWRQHNDSLNRRKNIFQYLRKYNLFRKEVRRLLAQSETNDKCYKIAYLYLPSFVPLFIRFWRMSRFSGFRSVLNKLIGRLKK